ncbi:unnamed protein product [Hymenolepis diminuta]|uniref:GOLD domain-containing protein n=1 Tax=Hymenolepis diminuta TaxID=6216 RepID=A0A3P6ZFI8_HYMDI|nr:unnamed protein product [Hymenolepis diminuta]
MPAHYGGTMRDPDGDPSCPSRICWGGTVPESYYQIQQTSSEEEGEGYQILSVGRGSKEYCFLGEAKLGDTVSWEFYSESNDIAFSLWVELPNESSFPLENSRRRSARSRNQNGGGKGEKSGMTTSFSFNNLLSGASSNGSGKVELKQITQPVRVDCDLVPEFGERKVELEGNYYLLFDNSYSWTRAKRIFCKGEVIQPVNSSPSRRSSVISTVIMPPSIPVVNGNSNNNLSFDHDSGVAECSVVEEVQKAVDVEIAEVMKAVCDPKYSSLSTIDVDITALMMILLRTLPIIRRRFRASEQLSPTHPSSPSFLRLKFKRPLKTPV